MSPAPTPSDPADLARQRDEDAQYYRRVLHRFIDMGTDLAEAVHHQAITERKEAAHPESDPASPPTLAPAPSPSPQQAATFDRLARTIRRTIALARKIAEPAREAPGPKERYAEGCDARCPAARQRRADCAETDTLHAEPCERPEGPDLDEDPNEDASNDLDEQSLADLIAAIRDDLGLATLPDAQLWKPRTPPSAQECARAAAPRGSRGLCTHREAIPPREHPREHPRSERKAARPQAAASTGNDRPAAAPPAHPATGPPRH